MMSRADYIDKLSDLLLTQVMQMMGHSEMDLHQMEIHRYDVTMPQCYVLNCGNYYSKTRNLSGTPDSVMYHVFPTSRRQALLWASLCRGDAVKEVPQYARVCSNHFSEANYLRDLQHELLGLPKRRKLIPDAMPDMNLPVQQTSTTTSEPKAKRPRKPDTPKTAPPTTSSAKKSDHSDIKLVNMSVLKRRKSVIEHAVKSELMHIRTNSSTVVSFNQRNFPSDATNKLHTLVDQKLPKSIGVHWTSMLDNKSISIKRISTGKNHASLKRGTKTISNGCRRTCLNIPTLESISIKIEPSKSPKIEPNKSQKVDSEKKGGVLLAVKKEEPSESESDSSRKSTKYPIRSSIRIAKKKSMQVVVEQQVAGNSTAVPATGSTTKGGFVVPDKYDSMRQFMFKLGLQMAVDGDKRNGGVPAQHYRGAVKSEWSSDDGGGKCVPALKRTNRMLVMEEPEQLISSPKPSESSNEDTKTGVVIESKREEDMCSTTEDATGKPVENSPRSEDAESTSKEPSPALTVGDKCEPPSSATDPETEPDAESDPTPESTKEPAADSVKRPLDDKSDPLPKKAKPTPDTDEESPNYETLKELEARELLLLADISNLDDLARKKEREWNSLIHEKKVKEELMLRLQRKRQVMLISKSDLQSTDVDWELALDLHIKALNSIQNNVSRPRMAQYASEFSRSPISSINCSDSGVTILPVPPSNKRHLKVFDGRQIKFAKHANAERSLVLNSINKQRSILPKPTHMPYATSSDCNGIQKTGPKGQPIMDVTQIVEQFRQNNPEDVPRRGKRIRTSKPETDSVSSTSRLLPMISLNSKVSSSGGVQVLPTKVDLNSELGLLLSSGSENNRGRESQNDSSRSSHLSTESLPDGGARDGGKVSFKDVLVEFARMSQSERRSSKTETTAAAAVASASSASRAHDMYAAATMKPLLPPCPEVTLHPVLLNGGTTTVTSCQTTPVSNSLLHGILTKSKCSPPTKPFTTRSPTLARLLTDTSSQPSDVSNINDLLANNQNRSPRRNTSIQPVQLPSQTSIALTVPTSSSQFNTTSAILNLDELETEDSLDRLVIDETHEKPTAEVETESGAVPTCQGCKQNPAQFVCAGCTSQWYCSRDCQVSDWDQHCEICSG